MLDHNHDSLNANGSLSWLAVQYVLGELSETELSAFEDRLATDTVACEAVVEATRFTLALQVAVADDVQVIAPADRPVARSHRRSWAALAGAATVASIVLAVMWLFPGDVSNQPEQRQVVRHDRSAAELVSMWRISSEAAAAEMDEIDADLTESKSEVAVPNWLLAAVSLEQSNSIGRDLEGQQEN